MTIPGGAARVLVADDDADIRALVGIAVRKAGLQLVAELDNGEAAWHAIAELVPDVVVLDVSMPGMTGPEVCRLVRADARVSQIGLLLLSAAVDDASRQIGLAAGADEYLVKPFSPRELMGELSLLASRVGVRT